MNCVRGELILWRNYSVAETVWPATALMHILGALFTCSIAQLAVAQEQERPRAIQAATEATVLIKTHLKHGFLEDDQATGRWEGSGFLINKESAGSTRR